MNPRLTDDDRNSLISIGSIASVLAIGSIASLASIGSIASIGSVGSIASIGSIYSIGSRNQVGAFLNIPVAEKLATALGRRLRDRHAARR